MDGQIDLFQIDNSYADEHLDRTGRKLAVPKWLDYERCENCMRWAMLVEQEQPPSGWGVYGFCGEHKQRTQSTGYCQCFEDKRRL